MEYRRVTQRLLASIAALAVALTLFAGRAIAAGDPRELKAREEFAAGRFQQALDIFTKLYAETQQPVYLRNIGRCYQNLGDPDKAIINFREYLRKDETVTPKLRKQIEGFIAEMEALKKEKSAAAGSARETSAAPPPVPVTPLPGAPEPKTAAPEAVMTAPAAPRAEESSGFYTRWWFWTLVGAVVVGAGIGIAAATGMFTKTEDGTCLPGYNCQ